MKYCLFLVAASCLLIVSCVTAKDNEFNKVAGRYRPDDTQPTLPVLKPDSPLSDFLTYALLNNPRIESAFYDWKQAAEEITIASSPPLPKLILGAEIQRSVMAFLPGLMAEVLWPDKLILQAEAYSAKAQGKRYLFEEEILRTIFKVKKTVYEAALLEDKIRLTKEVLILLEAQETLVQQNLSVGKKDVETKDLVTVQIEKERLQNDIVNLEDERKPLMARWGEALGVRAGESEPPLPAILLSENILPPERDLLKEALTRNLRLKKFEKEIREAETLVKLANKENSPNFSAELKADVKKAPLLWMPEIGITLPLWRKKIEAQVSFALAGERQARATLKDEEINLVVLLAEKSFMWRELNRQTRLLKEQVIPQAQIKIDNLIACSFSGMGMFSDLLNAQRELIEFKIMYAEALAERETIFTEVSTMVLSHWPEEITNIFEK